MNTRNSRNSHSAAYDALFLVLESEGILSRSVSAPSTSSLASTAPSICTSAVQQVLSVQQVASVPACSLAASMADSGGVPALSANSSQLAAQALSFTASGAGFQSSLPATATPPASGRPNNNIVLSLSLCRLFPLLNSVACSLSFSLHSPCSPSLEHHWCRIVSSIAWFTSTIHGGPWVFSCTGQVSQSDRG